MDILKLRIIHNIALFKRYDGGIEHFVEDEIPFYMFYSQSYKRIIEKIEPIIDSKNLAEDLQIACNELKVNPVIDTNYKEPFMCYEGLVESFEELLKETCLHELDGEYDGIVKCKLCSYPHFHWYCKKSPDKRCHYYVFDYDGKQGILLANGQVHKIKKEKWETSDSCYFCGHPKERK